MRARGTHRVSLWHDRVAMPTVITKRASSALRSFWLAAMVAAACDDGSKARIDALEGRITELERRTTDTSRALEPLATLPNTVEQHQASAKTIRDEQATLVARLARAEESIAALEAAGAKATTTRPLTTLGTETIAELHETPEVGVPECDEYLRKYRACVEDKVPAAARKSMLDAIATMSKAWSEAAAGPARDALSAGCKSADEASRKSFVAMGCTW